MNDLSLSAKPERNNSNSIPRLAIYILISLFLIGFGVSLFILVEVQNAVFFISFLSLFAIVAAFILWNARPNASLLSFLWHSPDSDLRHVRHGQLVKITGPVSCGNVALESSYEKVGSCVYTSTSLYEHHGLGFKALLSAKLAACFSWKLAYCERFSTDFCISDRNSGITLLVKGGRGCNLIPLITESRLVNTSRNTNLSPNLNQWLADRNLSADSCLIRLEEGYIREGDCVSVVGVLHTSDDEIMMIVEPPEMISTGCQWQRLLLPVDFHGLLLGNPQSN